VSALAAQGLGRLEPGVQPVRAGTVAAQVGDPGAAGQQGDVLENAEALLVELAPGVFEVRLALQYVDEAVEAGGLGAQGIQRGEARGWWQHVGQGDAQPWGGAEDLVTQGKGYLARQLWQLAQVSGALGEQVGAAVEPERRLAAALQAQSPDLVTAAGGQRLLIEAPVGTVGLEW